MVFCFLEELQIDSETIGKQFEREVISRNLYLRNRQEDANKQDVQILNFVSESEQLNDRKPVKQSNRFGRALGFVGDEIQSNGKILIRAIKQDCYALLYASKVLQNARGTAVEVVKQNGCVDVFPYTNLRMDTKNIDIGRKQSATDSIKVC